MDTKDIEYINIKTKPSINFSGIICFFGFLISSIFLIFININKTENNNIKYISLLIIITAGTFLLFAVEKMNLMTRVYIKFTSKRIIIYPGILSDKTVIYINDIKKIINEHNKIILILKNNDEVNILKNNMEDIGRNTFISKLSKESDIININSLSS